MKAKRTNRGGAEVAEENGEEELNNETSEIDEMKSMKAEGPSTFDIFVRFVVPTLLLPFAPLSATSARLTAYSDVFSRSISAALRLRFVPLEVKQP